MNNEHFNRMKRATSVLKAIVLLVILLFTISKAQAQVEGPNGHYYKIVLESGLLWEEARIKAADSTFNGQHGFLATINSLVEDRFIENLREQVSSNAVLWVGGSQQTNGTATFGWVWVNGEGFIPGTNGGDVYTNWLPGEPNDAGGPDTEQFLAINGPGSVGWSSEADDRHVQGYVVEYASAGAATKVSVVTIDPIAIESTNIIDVAIFEFRREGDLSLDLPVFYTISGNARNGDDYNEIPKSIIIPSGESSVQLRIVPRADLLTVVEPMETVGIRIEPSLILTPDAAYTINTAAREAAAIIYERVPPPAGGLQLAVPLSGTAYAYGEPVVAIAALSFSNVIDHVDFWYTSFNSPVWSNKLGTGILIQRTNELAFFKLTWADPVIGQGSITALAYKPDTNRLASLSSLIKVMGPTDPPQVRIRLVTPDPSDPVPDADYANGYFEVSRVGSTTGDLQVFYTISGDATAGADYETLNNYVVIGNGKSAAKITVTAIDDAIAELTESVTLSLVNSGSSYTLDNSSRQATVQILDNDGVPKPPIVSIETNPETSEPMPPDNSASGGDIIIRRTGSTDSPLDVYFNVGGAATFGPDYYFSNGATNKVTIAPGQSYVYFGIAAHWDGLLEGDETVVLELAPPPSGNSYTLNTNQYRGTITIHDEDQTTTLPIVTLEVADGDASEPPASNAGHFIFHRSGATNDVLTINVLYSGSATSGQDYATLNSSVKFFAGQRDANFYVSPLGDNLVEGDETVVAQILEAPTNGPGQFTYVVDVSHSSGVVTIHDAADTNVVVSIEATYPVTSEPLTNGVGAGQITVRRSGPTSASLQVALGFGGTATMNEDYRALSNSIAIPAGQSEFKFNVIAFGDDLVEGDETVIAEIAPSAQYTINPTMHSATITIRDVFHPSTNVVSIEATRPETSEATNGVFGAEGQFTFRRIGPTNEAMRVYYNVSGSAQMGPVGKDYAVITNYIDFPVGRASATLGIIAWADDLIEGDETVVIQLESAPAGAIQYGFDSNHSSATVTIHDRTPAPIGPHISQCEHVGNGVRLTLSGEPGQTTAILQRSSDLLNWNEVARLDLSQGPVQYTDENTEGGPRYYYRFQAQ